MSIGVNDTCLGREGLFLVEVCQELWQAKWDDLGVILRSGRIWWNEEAGEWSGSDAQGLGAGSLLEWESTLVWAYTGWCRSRGIRNPEEYWRVIDGRQS